MNDPWYDLPEEVRIRYAVPGANYSEPRPPRIVRILTAENGVIRLSVDKQHPLVSHARCQGVDRWVWDTDNPGHGRWLQLEDTTQ
jgi:hypothetical protein